MAIAKEKSQKITLRILHCLIFVSEELFCSKINGNVFYALYPNCYSTYLIRNFNIVANTVKSYRIKIKE
jgi:hypothetical protein